MSIGCLLTFLFISAIAVTGFLQRDADLITTLPGLDVKLGFKQYSGYLQGKTENVQLHYWFVEAVSNASTRPLVLWLNGGPGCSSLLGLLNENGPVLTGPDKKLSVNPFSWNLLANVLYLEAPAGVGFSYAVDKTVKTDDDIVAENNYAALLSFVKKFPEYRDRDFYISGESYGGVYVPTLALRVVEGKEMKLKAILVGNGLLSYSLNDNSLIYFGYYHGLLGERLWSDLLINCCESVSLDRCMFTMSKNSSCQVAILEASMDITTGFNIYNLYSECAGGVPTESIQTQSRVTRQEVDLSNLFRTNPLIRLQSERNNQHEVLMMTKKTKKEPSRFTRHEADVLNLFRNVPLVQIYRERQQKLQRKPHDKLVIPCSDDSDLTDYLNDASVREALHIPSTLGDWESCSNDVYLNYGRVYQELSKEYTRLVEEKIRVHIFNGDVDMACNFLGDEWFSNDLNIPLTNPRHAWFFNATDGTRQVGGFAKTFGMESSGTNLTYLTVKGSGHMVPEDKPAQAFTIFRSFLDNVYD